jgi:O-antigen/teichoic acid export membrane protein
VFLNASLLIHKQTGKMATILGACAVLNLALNWFFVPRMGLQAAALATLIAYLICTAWLAMVSFRFLPLRLSAVALCKYGLAAALAWTLAAAVELGSPAANLSVKCTVVAGVYFLVLYAADTRFRHASATFVRMILRRDSESAALAVSLSE